MSVGKSGYLDRLLGKVREIAARLALVLMLARDPNAEVVDAEAMIAGVRLAAWFAAEARRWYSGMAGTPGERVQAELLRKIRERFHGRVTARELRDTGRRYRPVEVARAALGELVTAGFGHWDVPDVGPEGGRPCEIFILASGHAPAGTETHKNLENN